MRNRLLAMAPASEDRRQERKFTPDRRPNKWILRVLLLRRIIA
jgi:hypothetical protein